MACTDSTQRTGDVSWRNSAGRMACGSVRWLAKTLLTTGAQGGARVVSSRAG